MASAEFIGLAVRVTLQSGIVISGVVATVEQASQTLTLRDASLAVPGAVPQALPFFSLPARDIADLQILPETAPAPVAAAARVTPLQLAIPVVSTGKTLPSPKPPLQSPKLPAPPPPPTKPKDKHKEKRKAVQTVTQILRAPADLDDEVDFNDVGWDSRQSQKSERQTAKVPPAPKVEKDRRQKRDRDGYMGQPSHWQQEDVQHYKLEEFDFQAALDKFDKPAIFAEIAQEDQTPYAERLVAHNRLPEGQQKLGIKEMVLSAEELQADNGGSTLESRAVQIAHSKLGLNGPLSTVTTPASSSTIGTSPGLPEPSSAASEPLLPPSFKSSATSQPVPTFSLARWTSFISRARTSGIVNMIAENAGRGGATLCLPLIMQARKKRKEAGKDASGASGCDVLVLAGDHETGGFALACARILGSYGVPVKTFVATDAEPCEAIAAQLAGLPAPLASAENLPQAPPLLIIDALCGAHSPATDGAAPSPNSLPSRSRGPTVAALRHIHALLRLHPIPILSFDIPAGHDAASGAAWTIPAPLEPRWTLAFGRPKEGLSRMFEDGKGKGEVVLAYVGDLGGEDAVFGDRFACGLVPLSGR